MRNDTISTPERVVQVHTSIIQLLELRLVNVIVRFHMLAFAAHWEYAPEQRTLIHTTTAAT